MKIKSTENHRGVLPPGLQKATTDASRHEDSNQPVFSSTVLHSDRLDHPAPFAPSSDTTEKRFHIQRICGNGPDKEGEPP